MYRYVPNFEELCHQTWNKLVNKTTEKLRTDLPVIFVEGQICPKKKFISFVGDLN